MMKITKQSRMNWNGSVVYMLPNELNGKKWNELFDSEHELLDAVRLMDVLNTMDVRTAEKKGYRGISFIISVGKILNEGKELSPKQITQLKRLASVVYSYNWNQLNTNYHK